MFLHIENGFEYGSEINVEQYLENTLTYIQHFDYTLTYIQHFDFSIYYLMDNKVSPFFIERLYFLCISSIF